MRIALAVVVGLLLVTGGVFAGRYTGVTPVPPPTPTAPPTATPVIVTSAGVVRQIQSLSRLELTRYTVETVVSAERKGVLGFGSEKMLVIFHGSVVAGVDLEKLAASDVSISSDGKTIAVLLPPVEILQNALDESKTRHYDNQQGWFTKHDPELDTIARQKAVVQILTSACEDGIVSQASKDSQQSIEGLLAVMGFQSVNVTIKTPTTSACPAPVTVTATPN